MTATMPDGRPLIGITPSHNKAEETFFVRENYISAVLMAGGLPIVLPYVDGKTDISAYLERLDGLLLPGGGDIDPKYYGEDRIPQCNRPDARRDACEIALSRGAIAKRMPVFGICRGCQVLAVALGSTLIQDIPAQCNLSAAAHRQTPPFDAPSHTVNLRKGGMLQRITGQEMLTVNSSHHQAVKRLGSGLQQEAFSEDGILEGFSLAADPSVFAVQFHPEHLVHKDAWALALFQYFVTCCAFYQRG